MDVKTVFLNGAIDIFIKIPTGIEINPTLKKKSANYKYHDMGSE